MTLAAFGYIENKKVCMGKTVSLHCFKFLSSFVRKFEPIMDMVLCVLYINRSVAGGGRTGGAKYIDTTFPVKTLEFHGYKIIKKGVSSIISLGTCHGGS